MKHDVDAFRLRYRAEISPRYRAWLHASFVLIYGVCCIGFFLSTLEAVQAWELLVIPVALVLFNLAEYVTHKHLGHFKHRFSALFYKRHTGDHHSFFVEGRMRYETAQDWRVILFPAALVVVVSVICFAAWQLLLNVNGNVAALFAASLLLGYLSYEVLHSCEHLPESHPVSGLPWIRHMRRHHELHHRRELMRTHNFNIVFPLMDWLFGTLYREPSSADKLDD